MSETETTTAPSETVVQDVDQLYESAMSTPSSQVPMQAAAAPPEPAKEPEYEITHNGQKIKAPLNKILQWASQGRDYPQKMEQFKAEQLKFQQEREAITKLQEQYKPYSEVDAYAKQNPTWWTHVLNQYQMQAQQLQQQAELANVPQPVINELKTLRGELNELRQFKESYSNEKLQEKRKSEDEYLMSEIRSIRNTYKDLDLDGIDESGKTLQMRVLEFARDNKLRSFEQAFKLFNHDKLLKIAEEKAKEKVGKDIQKRTKLGLLTAAPAPKQGITKATDYKSKTYDDLMREALNELGA